jgi:hypothetical protein
VNFYGGGWGWSVGWIGWVRGGRVGGAPTTISQRRDSPYRKFGGREHAAVKSDVGGRVAKWLYGRAGGRVGCRKHYSQALRQC